jgi:putative ABC transport system permease protein
MTRHLVKLVWNRKRATALLVLEIFVSFLVLFAVSTLAVIFLERIRHPLGFSSEDLYTASIDYRDFDERARLSDERERIERIVAEVRTLPEVVAVGAMTYSPFELAYSSTEVTFSGRTISAGSTAATDGLDRALEIELTGGRWFSPADDALDWTPVVVNQRLVDRLFGTTDPLGQTIDDDPQLRVVGVVHEFRKNGVLSSLEPYFIRRASLGRDDGSSPPRRIMVKVAPGTGAEIEERVLEVMRAAEPQWLYQIEPTDRVRRRNLSLAMAPLVAAGLLAGFMLMLVFLGMIGVFWQSVTQRRGEIGLRRAMGAARGAVYLQLLVEIVVLTSFGAVLATLLILQLPLLGVLASLSWSTVVSALGLSLILIYALALASGLYPAWLGARVEPADALHDE